MDVCAFRSRVEGKYKPGIQPGLPVLARLPFPLNRVETLDAMLRKRNHFQSGYWNGFFALGTMAVLALVHSLERTLHQLQPFQLLFSQAQHQLPGIGLRGFVDEVGHVLVYIFLAGLEISLHIADEIGVYCVQLQPE